MQTKQIERGKADVFVILPAVPAERAVKLLIHLNAMNKQDKQSTNA